ncbi:MAG: GNAT family N-acetyltransferase [Gemmatales bacterium]|nr:GNAT family N-acetyltransferase [Gemmatales bacterium]MDW8386196.1 GNAT family N-acetyltransferase [Gemmatales bacterium]
MLWHGDKPIGICIFTAPARSLRLRNRCFGLKSHRGPLGRLLLQRLNRELWTLARVVLHPTYRGAGIAADFVHASCRACPVDWIETLSAMGHVHPFFERAGFRRIGVVSSQRRDERGYCQIYGGRRLSSETVRKSRHAEPVYYLFDNRKPESGHAQSF